MKNFFDKLFNLNFGYEMQIYILIGALFLMVLVCLVLIIIVSQKYNKLRAALANEAPFDVEDSLGELESDDFYRGEEVAIKSDAMGVDSEIDMQLEKIYTKIESTDAKIEEITLKQQKCFDKIKVLRYNQTLAGGKTFECFSIGITNAMSDGIILTCNQTESGATKVVVKSIKDGNSNIELTEAEKVAVLRKGEKTC